MTMSEFASLSPWRLTVAVMREFESLRLSRFLTIQIFDAALQEV